MITARLRTRDRRKMGTFQGERLRQLRIAKGYDSQQALADQLNIHQQEISMWERGQREPKTDELYKLAKLLDCSTDYLLGLVDSDGDRLLNNWKNGGWEAAGALIFERLSQQLRERRDIPPNHSQ